MNVADWACISTCVALAAVASFAWWLALTKRERQTEPVHEINALRGAIRGIVAVSIAFFAMHGWHDWLDYRDGVLQLEMDHKAEALEAHRDIIESLAQALERPDVDLPTTLEDARAAEGIMMMDLLESLTPSKD